jgi:hypothetical protein
LHILHENVCFGMKGGGGVHVLSIARSRNPSLSNDTVGSIMVFRMLLNTLIRMDICTVRVGPESSSAMALSGAAGPGLSGPGSAAAAAFAAAAADG